MSRVVRLVANVDYKKLPLTPVEGNVFSRIDGKATEADIGKLTGFHPETISKALDRLIELGAAENAQQAKNKEQASKEAKVVASMALGGSDANAPLAYEARDLDEDVDLDVAKKKQILDGFHRLDKLNYYELLGLHPLVDKKQIKAAYYQVAPEYHPDKYFRKNLGSFKQKIEAIFARLTLAHDTLSSKQRRAEYDDYLATLEQNRKASELLGDFSQSVSQIAAAAQSQIEERARATAQAGGDGLTDARRASLLTERKRALAAKLSMGRAGQTKAEPSAAPPPVIDPRAAAEALRVRYEMARNEAQKAQIAKYVDQGRASQGRKDWPAAANAFRIAASLAPNDVAVQREAAEVQHAAAVALAEGFAKQGEYELNQERWAEAAISFSKACAGRPDDARVHDRAAHATFKAGNNPRRAVDLARRAVEIMPKAAAYRVTLGYAYMAAGLDTSAAAELDRALELGAADDRVKGAVAQARDALRSGAYAPKKTEEKMSQAPAPAPSNRGGAAPSFGPPPDGALQQQQALQQQAAQQQALQQQQSLQQQQALQQQQQQQHAQADFKFEGHGRAGGAGKSNSKPK